MKDAIQMYNTCIQKEKHMRSVKVRNLTIGEGIPAVCIPICGKNKEEILQETAAAIACDCDLIEWRADWFEDCLKEDSVLSVLKDIRSRLKNIPLLFTFRSFEEGGKREISSEEYVSLISAAINSGMIDLIDIELFKGKEIVTDLISKAHSHQVKVILSNHDFEKTPSREEIIARLCEMQNLNGDITKIAVMPQSDQDVFILLEAASLMKASYADRPYLTISMSSKGTASRICCELYGSCITFGSGAQASAPGQINASDLKTILSLIHKSIG